MLTLKKVKELVEAPSHAKRTPSPKMLFEEGIVLLRREFDQGSHLTVYNSGYVLFSAGKRNTVFHIHDCQGDYAYDAAEGKGDVIEEEYFENCEWHIRALFEGERKMEDNQAKCEDAGRSNVCVSYHALSEDWSEVADRTINMLEKIIENEAVHAMLAVLTDKQRDLIKGGKITAQILKAALIKLLAEMDKKKQRGKGEKSQCKKTGRQSIKSLQKSGAQITNIVVTDNNIKSFDRVARKYGIDYSLKKVEQEGKTEYLVFFKAKDVDVMTAAFKEYTSETLKKQKRESVRQKLEKVKEELSNHRQLKKEKKREQEPTR